MTVALPRPKVNPRSPGFPVFNEDNGKVENPEIPARNTYFEDIAVLALPAEGVVPKDRVLDLSANCRPTASCAGTHPRASGSFTGSAIRRREP